MRGFDHWASSHMGEKMAITIHKYPVEITYMQIVLSPIPLMGDSMSWFKSILGMCGHKRYGWPQKDGDRHTVACADCPAKFEYDMAAMKRGKRI